MILKKIHTDIHLKSAPLPINPVKREGGAKFKFAPLVPVTLATPLTCDVVKNRFLYKNVHSVDQAIRHVDQSCLVKLRLINVFTQP